MRHGEGATISRVMLKTQHSLSKQISEENNDVHSLESVADRGVNEVKRSITAK